MSNSTYPYGDILRGLVAATMRAQGELARALSKNQRLEEVPHGNLNRHFSWLTLVYPPGTNRHLFDPALDAAEAQYPLRTAHLLNRGRDASDQVVSMPSSIRKRLRQMLPPEQGGNVDPRYVQVGPTRISQLIRSAFAESVRIHSLAQENSRRRTAAVGVDLVSPLAILYDYLTVPGMPGTRAYALLALRNFIFEEFKIVPSVLSTRQKTFAVGDIEDSLSHVWTSLRPRYLSLGQDKLPPEGSRADAVVRQFLGLRNILYFHFPNARACANYLSRGSIRPRRVTKEARKYQFEFTRSPHLAKLPEAGELINELMGLPLPVRGADTIFRGGLKFSARQGLVVAVHGGPGTGKTSLALALCAYLAPLGVQAVFLTAEENEQDLWDRMVGLVPDDVRRLSFFPDDFSSAIRLEHVTLTHDGHGSVLAALETSLQKLAQALKDRLPETSEFSIPKPCRAIVVLDGLHDLFAVDAATGPPHLRSQVRNLYSLIERLKDLQALVILTTGHEWAGDAMVDYLVDVTLHLSHQSVTQYGEKPDRRVLLSKARHQLCASGTHGFHLAGVKGVRFSPQINYQLDRRAVWKTRLPDPDITKRVLRRALAADELGAFETLKQGGFPRSKPQFVDTESAATIFGNSHILLNGERSGGKAALALKIAIAPSFSPTGIQNRREKVLIVSFLYPEAYYDAFSLRLSKLHVLEYGLSHKRPPQLTVIQLYPGHLKPNDLYNRIEWELEAAELKADPYTCVIIDGIHNVFLQFPDIQDYGLFWPQLYSALRSRPITTITTHTTLSVQKAVSGSSHYVDDNRSEPLRHALVQKTDFQFEVDPYSEDDGDKPQLSELFAVRTVSAIGQSLPSGHMLWSREALVLVEPKTRSSE